MSKKKIYYYFKKQHKGSETTSYKSVVIVFDGAVPSEEIVKNMYLDIQNEDKKPVYHKEVADWEYIGLCASSDDSVLLFGDEINIAREAVFNYSKEQNKKAEQMRQPLRKYLKMFVSEIDNLILKLS